LYIRPDRSYNPIRCLRCIAETNTNQILPSITFFKSLNNI
jgi:hypothetical protein